METLNPFDSDAFGLVEMTAAMNRPVEGQNIAASPIDALFNAEGVTQKSVWIDRDGDAITLIDPTNYGAPGDVTTKDRRDAIDFGLLHYQTHGAVMAHEVMGVRAFGAANMAETVESKRDKELAKIRARIDATIRFQRVKALQGQIVDSKGAVKLDLLDKFGVTQQTSNLVLSSSTTKVKSGLLAATDKSADALGGAAEITGYAAFCGRNWHDALTTHSAVETAFQRQADGAYLRESQAEMPFNYLGITFYRYFRKAGSVEFINPDEAWLVPIVTDPDAYMTRFGPADYMETVNTIGMPYYARSELMKMGKGVELEGQTNVINICRYPRSIIKLTKS